RDAASKKILLEVSLLKAIQARQAVSLDSVLKHLQDLRDGKPGETIIVPAVQPAPSPKPFRAEAAVAVPPASTVAAAAPAAIAPAAAAPPKATVATVATAQSAKEKPVPVPFNKDDFKNDPLIQKALEIFKGQIVEVRA